jgi:hypothetical protein
MSDCFGLFFRQWEEKPIIMNEDASIIYTITCSKYFKKK